ncbi:MAG: type II toxin-antitoxin system Phd/YefM family antitoxin [Acidobacteriota bacterium]
MRKSISTQELKSRVGEVVDAVRLRGDRYVIVRRGKPVAAIVPLSVNESYERKRTELIALMNDVASRNRRIPAERIEEAIEQAVGEVRRRRRRKRVSE